MLRLTFWQNSASLHQAPVIRALASSADTSVRVVTAAAVSEQRAKLGWELPHYGAADVSVAPDRTRVRQMIEAARRDDAHIFSGVAPYPALNAIRGRLATVAEGELVAMSESWDPRGPVRRARNAVAPFRFERAARQYHRFLACGDMAAWQLSRIAAPEDVVDYGYFVDSSIAEYPRRSLPLGVHSIAYVAQLVPRKDPTILLRALSALKRLEWHLHVVGDGPLRGQLQSRAQRLGIASRVTFHGAVPHQQARTLLARSDLLVLPSRYDGWGAVVNEALMDGVPVIVSSMVGAKVIVTTQLQGSVFRAGSVRDLAAKIATELQSAPDDTRKERLRCWAAQAISPAVVAQYLRKVVDPQVAGTMKAPWKP